MYWCTNNVISLIQGQALKYPPIRDAFGIPATPKPEEIHKLKMVNPFRRVADVSTENHWSQLSQLCFIQFSFYFISVYLFYFILYRW